MSLCIDLYFKFIIKNSQRKRAVCDLFGIFSLWEVTFIRFIWKTQRFLHKNKKKKLVCMAPKLLILNVFKYTHYLVPHTSFVSYSCEWRSDLSDGFISHILWLEHFPPTANNSYNIRMLILWNGTEQLPRKTMPFRNRAHSTKVLLWNI